MRRMVALAACAFAVLAAAAEDAPRSYARTSGPDTKETYNAVYARRGSLGADDYVATNVPPVASAWAIAEVRGALLRDRTVNTVSVDAPSVTLRLPAERTVEGFARGLLVVVSAERQTDVWLSGAESVWGTASKASTLSLKRGLHVIQVIEIGSSRYLVESRELERFTE